MIYMYIIKSVTARANAHSVFYFTIHNKYIKLLSP